MNGVPIAPYELSQFWEREPLANILMFPGALSGVDVIDVDTKPGKKSGFETLSEHGLDWVIEEALLVFTPTGNGLHLYFKHTVDSPNNKKPPGTGLELFCAGNQYVLMPPSTYLDTDVSPHQLGFYTCNDFNLDGLNPVPQDLVNFFVEKGFNSPDQKSPGYAPKGELNTLPATYPPFMAGMWYVPRKTLVRVGLEAKRELREKNSLKHLARNTEFPSKVRELRIKSAPLQSEMKQLKSQYDADFVELRSKHRASSDIENALQPKCDDINIVKRALNRIEEQAHSMLSHLFKKRHWFLLECDDGTINGWIFKFKGRWHWVGMPGTKHDGIEVVPTPEELASQKGKRTKYIIHDDGSIIVQFIKHSESGTTSKVGWYYLYEGEYPELDEFI